MSGLQRFGFHLLFACMLVAGCTNDTAPSAEEKLPADQAIAVPEEGKTEDQAKGYEKQVLLNQDFLPLLVNNQINGFDLTIGMSKADVIARYGAVTKEDFYEGGLYQEFEKLQNGIVYFDGSDRVYAIHLAASHMNETNLTTMLKALGTPIEQGVSMVDDKYILYYEAGDNSVFISADNLESPAQTIKIINKVMLDESPQKHDF